MSQLSRYVFKWVYNISVAYWDGCLYLNSTSAANGVSDHWVWRAWGCFMIKESTESGPQKGSVFFFLLWCTSVERLHYFQIRSRLAASGRTAPSPQPILPGARFGRSWSSSSKLADLPPEP